MQRALNEILNHGLSLGQELRWTAQVMVSTALWPAAEINLPKRYFSEKIQVKHTWASTDMHVSGMVADMAGALVQY